MGVMEWMQNKNLKRVLKQSDKYGVKSAKVMMTSMMAAGMHYGQNQYPFEQVCKWLVEGRQPWLCDGSGMVTYSGSYEFNISDITSIEDMVGRVVAVEISRNIYDPEFASDTSRAGRIAASNYVLSRKSRIPFRIIEGD